MKLPIGWRCSAPSTRGIEIGAPGTPQISSACTTKGQIFDLIRGARYDPAVRLRASSTGLGLYSALLATVLSFRVVSAAPGEAPQSVPTNTQKTKAKPEAKGNSGSSNAQERSTTAGRGNATSGGTKAASIVHKGRPPKQPAATLPDGLPRPEPNAEYRRSIAAGPTDDDRSAPLDAELQVLQEAERVMFPRPLPGVRSGWSWERDNGFSEPEGPGGSFILPPEISVSERKTPSEPVGKWLGDLVLPNLPTRFEPNVVTYLQFYRVSSQGKGILRTWAKKSGRYSKLIATEFAKAGLPTDLLWQSVIESGHNPAAKSAAGAVGLWQFMPDTARAYGLVVDRWVDERLDPQRSTEASAKLLADLHRRFGNWELAMAAYNMGYAGLGRAIRKYNTNDYWLLCRYEGGLPWETTLYVPKIESLAIAMNNRSVFGIDDVEPEPATPSDVVSVGPGLPLATIAKAASVSESEIAQLNPQFLAGRTPPAAMGQNSTVSYAIRVPAGSGSIVARKTAGLPSPETTWETYVIKQGDTLESIARSANQPVAELRSLNQVGATEILVPGDLLLLPKRDRPLDVDIADDERVVVISRDTKTPTGTRRVFYRVVAGDTLSSIARAFEVRRSDLLDWNSIDTTARLQAKMVLVVYVPQNQSLSKVRYLAEPDVRVLTAGSQQFAEYFEGLRGNDRVVVQAHAGDTLTSIANKYHVNVSTLERINRRPRNSRFAEGDNVVLYAPRGKVSSGSRASKETTHADSAQPSSPKLAEPQSPVPVKPRINATGTFPDAG